MNDEVYAVGGKIIPKFETERPSWLVEGLEYSYTIVDLGKKEENIQEIYTLLGLIWHLGDQY